MGLAYLIRKKLNLLFGPSTFAALVGARISPHWIPASAKHLAEIAIVDDNPDDFPVAELRKAAYNLRVYKTVGLNDIPRLALYDVVFLDIHGIVKDDTDTGGLNVITQLRAINPFQKICAVSSKKFDPTATAFFKQADDVQNKPMRSQKCEELIDTLSREKLDPNALAKFLDTHAQQLSFWRRKKLVRAVETFAASEAEPRLFPGFDDALDSNRESLKLVVADFIRVLRHAAS